MAYDLIDLFDMQKYGVISERNWKNRNFLRENCHFSNKKCKEKEKYTPRRFNNNNPRKMSGSVGRSSDFPLIIL